MPIRPVLVLDIAGVLATNFSPDFWNSLTSNYRLSFTELIEFKKEIREELWTGTISEEVFWCRLKKKFPLIEINDAKVTLLQSINPLLAVTEIPYWAEIADIHVISNHRLEWVAHVLNPIQPYLSSITISAEVGYCKPQPEIYELVRCQIASRGNVLYVDDKEKNLHVPRTIGWGTLLADENGEWIKEVAQILQGSSS
ncbi:HAD family hydrolase [Fredinandcohnia humi]